MFKNLISLMLAITWLTSCSSTYFIIEPDYQDKVIKDKSLAIVFETPEIENEDDVTDDIGVGNVDSVFTAFFINDFPQKINGYSFLSRVSVDNYSDKPILVKTKYNLSDNSKETHYINLPEDNAYLQLKIHKDADIVLYINEFKIWRNAAQSGMWMPGPNGTQTYTGGKSPDLEYEAKFFFWDNKNRKLISYGTVNSNAAFLFAMSKEDWEANNSNFAKKILRASPFSSKATLKKKYINKKKKNGSKQPDSNSSNTE